MHSLTQVVLGICAIINMVLWASTGLLSMWVLQRAVTAFRGGGGVPEMRRQHRQLAAASSVMTASSV
jgi:hypothetical protein